MPTRICFIRSKWKNGGKFEIKDQRESVRLLSHYIVVALYSVKKYNWGYQGWGHLQDRIPKMTKYCMRVGKCYDTEVAVGNTCCLLLHPFHLPACRRKWCDHRSSTNATLGDLGHVCDVGVSSLLLPNRVSGVFLFPRQFKVLIVLWRRTSSASAPHAWYHRGIGNR